MTYTKHSRLFMPWDRATLYQTLQIRIIYNTEMFVSIESLMKELKEHKSGIPGLLDSMDLLQSNMNKLSRKIDRFNKKKTHAT
jgi:hypothetical protein